MPTKIKFIAALFVVNTVVGFTTGCSTIHVHNDKSISVPGPYVGTKRAIKKTEYYWNNYSFYGQPLYVAMDVPLCFVADTLVLPIDLYRANQNED
ncbi:hypothetical protein [Kaarinaea lacus]